VSGGLDRISSRHYLSAVSPSSHLYVDLVLNTIYKNSASEADKPGPVTPTVAGLRNLKSEDIQNEESTSFDMRRKEVHDVRGDN